MPTLGIPYFLEDKTGLLSGSEFVDVHDRMRLSVRCTLKDSMRTAYMIYDLMNPNPRTFQYPAATLDYGPNDTLGTIHMGIGGMGMSMNQYLVKLSPFGSSKCRKFTASDGQEYHWSWRSREGFEWTCLNSSGYLVAYYNLKIPDEHYVGSSGCMLTVDESYPHLVVDLLASLLIMRHIAEHNL
ncbi:hypothetical protein BV25DRAFT_1192093 [Artomyces pyxidatus]|uniref:Uncharacterized protein n=1 Tax=Artomyces pyxidatus TaxID=48021 RepID=A0ACB8SQE6_9AGAM|nr:hypothetical protein BV25DRAFT_1192093 [Artomyces pyxidatus]